MKKLPLSGWVRQGVSSPVKIAKVREREREEAELRRSRKGEQTTIEMISEPG